MLKAAAAMLLTTLGFAIKLPDFCVRKIEKIINTTMPPTYTAICIAAIKLAFIQKYNAATPIKQNNNQMAARNIFLVVTASTPVVKTNAAMQ